MGTDIFIYSSLVLFVISWVAFDIYIIIKKGKRASISAHIIRNSKKYPMMVMGLGLALGVLFGHLFWSMRSQDYLSKDDFKKECLEFLETVD